MAKAASLLPQTHSPKIDAYIEKAQPFAQEILSHFRELVHKACPEVEETMKWSQPFFVYRGAVLCHMAGFKSHCTMHFWGKEIGAVLAAEGVQQEGRMGPLSRVGAINDFPSDKQVLGWLKQAVAFIESGQYTSPMAGRTKKAIAKSADVPQEFKRALTQNKKAASNFDKMSPSCKREYVEWISDAKRAETREKRIATAIEWIAEGKSRNWKYQAER